MEEYEAYNREFFDTSGFERLRELPKRSLQIMELAKNVSTAFTDGDLGILKQTVSFFCFGTNLGISIAGMSSDKFLSINPYGYMVGSA